MANTHFKGAVLVAVPYYALLNAWKHSKPHYLQQVSKNEPIIGKNVSNIYQETRNIAKHSGHSLLSYGLVHTVLCEGCAP